MRLLSELQNNNMEKRQSIFIFGITIMLYSILKILSFNDGMFWDSILILSKTATFLHDNGLSSFIYRDWETDRKSTRLNPVTLLDL